MRYGLGHQLSASTLSDSSLEVDAACHTGHLEDLHSNCSELISLELDLHILLFVKNALKRLCGTQICFVDFPIKRLNHKAAIGKICLVNNR